MIGLEQTVISQYANSPTLMALVSNMNGYVDPRADLDTFFDYVWNVETAQGFGLDTWGRIVGVGRVLSVPVDTPNPGYSPFTPGVYSLSDDQYRTLILVKALANITSGTSSSFNQLLSNLFVGRGRCYVLDTGYMTMEYRFEFYLEPFEYCIIMNSGVYPRPAGVLANIFQCDPTQTFGFDEAIQFQPFDQGVFFP